MEEKQNTLEMLTGKVISYLKKLSYSDSRISQYRADPLIPDKILALLP